MSVERTTMRESLPLAVFTTPARADVIQLVSPEQLGDDLTTVLYTSTDDLLASPLAISTDDNTLTFILAAGDWRRLDEGVNVLSDFAPGTHLLYTNGNNGFGLDGQGSVGGGGSGPAEIRFADGVRAFGLRAETQCSASRR